MEVRRKKEEGITDTWVSIISSSCLLSRVHAWPAGVSCRLAGVRSSAYKLASDPPPQTFPCQSRRKGGREAKDVKEKRKGREKEDGKTRQLGEEA